MYRYLLCSRYLRSRYIALASIISVTLGVATMIVVNSVMSGFRHEMYERLHGILSDVVVEAQSLSGFPNVEEHIGIIRQVVGDDLQGITASAHAPAVLSFRVRDQWITRSVNLIGIDEQTYTEVGDFSKFLLHPANREKLSFFLREDGYDERLGEAGWGYRRDRVAYERALREQWKQASRTRPGPSAPQDPFRRSSHPPAPQALKPETATGGADESATEADPDAPPRPPRPTEVADDLGLPSARQGLSAGTTQEDEQVFDEMHQQYTGVVLGIAIGSLRHRDADGEVKEYFLCRPGDDVRISLFTTGTPPKGASDTLTIVDFYESKMSEYDSGFAFMPLWKLQELRGMIDPQTGKGNVTSIQIKLAEGTDLRAVRDKLRAAFPASEYAYRIQTWRDMQGPLLSAVQMETIILNILLFLIIAVAGFGILATFYMIVVEKTRDIGILKALGARSSGVMSIFLAYGLSLGAVGSGVGLLLGLLFVAKINEIAGVIEWVTGQEVFDETIYYFREIPTIVSPFTIGWIMTGAMLIAVAASILPALRAARLHPVEALRYE